MARKAEVVITCNTQQSQMLIKALEQQLNKVTASYNALVKAGQGGSQQAKLLKKEMTDLNTALKYNRDATGKVDAVMRNLSGSTIRQLQGALKEVKKQMLGKSEDSVGMAKLRAQYQAINEQIEKTRTGTVNIERVMKNLKGTSLDKLRQAADQLEREMSKLSRTTKSYAEKKDQLRRVREELERARTSTVNVNQVLNNLKGTSIDNLRKAASQLEKEMSKLGRTTTAYGVKQAQLRRVREEIEKTRTGTVNVERVMKNLKGSSLNQLRLAASQLEKEMAKLNRTTKSYAEKQKQLVRIREEISRTTSALTSHGSAWSKTIQAVSAYMGITMILGKVKSMLGSIVSLNLKFSDQLADIRKVSGLAMVDINNLATRLAGIDTRTTIQELNQIAYAGAKLGIGKYGVEGLEGFSNAANQVNVALKEDLGEDALTALSKITEVMGLIPTMGVEKSMLATGSAMFKLSATSTATAGNIVEFAKRLTGMARSAGITTDQLLGLGSAADSMYLMPEVASTAFNKFISSLQTNHNLIEKNLSIEPGTIGRLYEAGQIVDAMVLVFEKMKEKGNMNALKPIFKDLGSDGARLVNVMVTMSQNVDMLKEHLNTSKTAFKEATAVTDEYNIQQETAQALMERASNLWEKAFVNPEGVDNVHDMAKAWYDMSKQLTESSAYIGSIRLAFDLLLAAVKGLIFILPGLITFLALKGAYAAVMGLVTGWKVLVSQIGAATTAQRTFNAATKANVWLALASVILTAVTAIGSWISASREAAKANETLSNSMTEVNNKIGQAQSEAYRYRKAIEDAAEGSEARNAAIKNFNDKFGTYLSKMLTEKSTALEIASAYDEVTKAIRRKMLQEAMQDDMKKNVDVAFGWSVDKLDQYNTLAGKSSRNNQYNANWLKGQAEDMWGKKKDAETAIRQTLKFFDISPEIIEKAIANRGKAVPKSYARIQYRQGADSPMLAASGIGTNTIIKNYTVDEQMAFAAANYIAQHYSWHNREKKVKQKYEPYKDMLEDPVITATTDLGDLDNDAPDPNALREAKRQLLEQKKAMRENLKEAQDEGKAIVDNVKNYYERQLTEMMRLANEQNWDEALIESARDAILARENLALSEVRKGIVGVKNNWEEFKQTMQNDMIETADEVGYNESQELLDNILSNNLRALHDKIAGLTASLGLPTGSAFSAILKNATLNEKAIETAEMRHNREQTKIRLEDDYTAKVNNQYSSSMTRLGYFDITEQQAETLLAGGEEAENLLKKRGEEIASIFANVRSNFTQLLDIVDPESEDGLIELEKILYGGEPDYEKLTLKPFLRESETDVRLFYEQLIKYNNDYIEAVKQADDRTKKLYDFMWGRSAEKNTIDNNERENTLYARGLLQHSDPEAYGRHEEFGLYGNLSVMQSFGVDPEVEGYRLRMEAAKAYYDFILAHGASEAQLNEQRKAMIDAQNEYVGKLAANIKEQMDSLLSLTQPIQDFGLKAGDALATLADDAEEGKKAMKSAVAEMVNSLLKQTVEMTQDYIKRRIMQRVHDRLTSIEAKKHQADLTATQIEGEQTREILHTTMQTGLADIDKKVSVERIVTQKTENAEELTDEASATTGKVTLGIAGGAAKTIGSLGWWGIPLVAVITALLNALLGAAMSKVSGALGGKNKSTGTTQSKLVSGMLTYDSGNVQSFRGVIDGSTYPVVGDDGNVYAAKDGGELSTGLVKDAITTFVNGQPALVAEKGPEMVIGRETTAAMMMARPDIITEIVKFDRNRSGRTYRAFDEGNLDRFNVSSGMSTEDVVELRSTIQQLSIILSAIQQNGIKASINKYGRGGIVEETRSGTSFMRRNAGIG